MVHFDNSLDFFLSGFAKAGFGAVGRPGRTILLFLRHPLLVRSAPTRESVVLVVPGVSEIGRTGVAHVSAG